MGITPPVGETPDDEVHGSRKAPMLVQSSVQYRWRSPLQALDKSRLDARLVSIRRQPLRRAKRRNRLVARQNVEVQLNVDGKQCGWQICLDDLRIGITDLEWQHANLLRLAGARWKLAVRTTLHAPIVEGEAVIPHPWRITRIRRRGFCRKAQSERKCSPHRH